MIVVLDLMVFFIAFIKDYIWKSCDAWTGVTMISGDHSIRKVGIPISLNQDKLPEDDADIIVQDDVWIGANVTVLKGVTIGRGAVVAAGSVLTHSVLPYLVVGGFLQNYCKTFYYRSGS